MFFRMLRLLAPVDAGSSPEFPRCEQHTGSVHRCSAEKTPAESQDLIIAWFLVQPMNIATGRLSPNPMMTVASSI